MVNALPVVVRMTQCGCGTCRTERASNCCKVTAVFGKLFNPAGQTLASGRPFHYGMSKVAPASKLQGRTNGFVQSALVRMAPCQPVAVTMPSCGSGIGSKKLAPKCQDTSWIWAVAFHPNGQMVAPVEIKPCSSGMRDGICCQTLQGHEFGLLAQPALDKCCSEWQQ